MPSDKVDLDDIIAFEEGTITDERKTALFQNLVDTGQAWTLQGFYGREACRLIAAGVVTVKDPASLPPMAKTHIAGLEDGFQSSMRSR